ncbi:HD domain-containing protein [Pseudomonas sp. RIT-PI-S]|uniref:HD domain-containing protein n=1 Tax=Pseudomonas sp. RIT-PI-S TaxID=3035295 RepID=UPI0021D9E871|nr:HD domain-containing protein [Pseudomonas sp. RIT-PI-S]
MNAINLPHLYNKAWLFASQAHINQKMKGSELPYATHVAMVANELIFASINEPIGILDIALPAALLHDVLEDTPTTQEELAAVFGVEVASTVACLSKNLITPFSEEKYLRGIAEHSQEAACIKLCDRITNLQSAPATWGDEKRVSYLAESHHICDVLGDVNGYLKQRLTDSMSKYKNLYINAV